MNRHEIKIGALISANDHKTYNDDLGQYGVVIGKPLVYNGLPSSDHDVYTVFWLTGERSFDFDTSKEPYTLI